MAMEYYLLTPTGQEGPYQEAELLDLLAAGEMSPEERCVQEPSGQERSLGEWFEVISPPDSPMPPRLGNAVHWSGRPSVLAALGPWLLAVVAVWLATVWQRSAAWVLPGGLMLAAGALGVVLARASRWQFLITEQRVEARHGWFQPDSWEMRLTDIRTINVRHDGLAGLCGIGRIAFASGAREAEEVVFQGVRGAAGIQALVRQLQATATLRE